MGSFLSEDHNRELVKPELSVVVSGYRLAIGYLPFFYTLMETCPLSPEDAVPSSSELTAVPVVDPQATGTYASTSCQHFDHLVNFKPNQAKGTCGRFVSLLCVTENVKKQVTHK